MKIRQLCLAMLAATTMWSCAKDDVVKNENGLMGDEPKAISIKIVNPTTKVNQAPANATVEIQNLTLKLNGTFTNANPQNGETQGEGFRFKYFETLNDAQNYVFYGVKEVQSMEVYINHASENFLEDGTIINTSNAETQTELGQNAVCYGIGTVFTQNGTGEFDNKTYNKYTVTVKPTPMTVRFELSGVKAHYAEGADVSKFKSIHFAGICLNGYYENGDVTTGISSDTKNVSVSPDGISTADYLSQLKQTIGMGDFMPETFNLIGANNTYIDHNFPEVGTCYGYNIFVKAGEIPTITVAFDNCSLVNTVGNLNKPEIFARVKNLYTQTGETKTPITTLTPGNIYRITSIIVNEDKIDDPESAVSAIVQVQPWNINLVNVEF